MVLVHIVGWKQPHLGTQEVNVRHWKAMFLIYFLLSADVNRFLTRPYTSPLHQPLWPFLERILMLSPSRSDNSERSRAEKSYLALATLKLRMLPPVRWHPHNNMDKGLVWHSMISSMRQGAVMRTHVWSDGDPQTWRGSQRATRHVVRRVALLRLLERCTQRRVHVPEVLLQRVLLVELNHLLTKEEERVTVTAGWGWDVRRERRAKDLRSNTWMLSSRWCGTDRQWRWF